jgi:hypothetical protein
MRRSLGSIYCSLPQKPGQKEGHRAVGTSLIAHWAALEEHFQRHAQVVGHFRNAGPEAVVRMWNTQTNEDGDHLSRFEREALIERHCELFGTWPQ